MDYKKNYFDYINYIKQSNRKLKGYFEVHHIIPKCLGGSNEKSNLVELTAKEHFLAHFLLTKIYPDNSKLIDAFRMMGVVNKNEQTRYINSKLYESYKEKFNEARSKKVVCIETGEIFPSAAYAEKHIINGIRDVIYGKQLTAGGYHWKYLDKEPIVKQPFQRKKVVCAETGYIFNNTDEAAKFAGVNSSLIRSLCNGSKTGKANNYTFYYYDKNRTNYPIRKDYSHSKKIICVETGIVYNSVKEVGHSKKLFDCLKGRSETFKGYHWKYI